MYLKRIINLFIFISLFAPAYLNAQIKITEIMYDPEGSDTKREWIEVFNSGTTDVDLNTYYLLENNVYHKLVSQTGGILNPGSYAIIVDSIAEVVADYRDFMGQIFDSTFSLNNTGETLSVTNINKEIIDTVTYDSLVGANNDGKSLQINDEHIISAEPTFGQTNSTQPEPPLNENYSSDTSADSPIDTIGSSIVSSHTQQEGLSKYTPTSLFKIGAGRNRTVTVDTPIDFKAHVSKAEIKPRITWNFGDFETGKGSKATHIYTYPGVYEIVLEGKSKDFISISRAEVTVVEPEVEVSFSSSIFSLHNQSKKEVNLGGFELRLDGDKSFVIPKNTIIKGGSQLNKKMADGTIPLEFVYPNGEIYYRFGTI